MAKVIVGVVLAALLAVGLFLGYKWIKYNQCASKCESEHSSCIDQSPRMSVLNLAAIGKAMCDHSMESCISRCEFP